MDKNIGQVIQKIKQLKIQGATNIAKESVLALSKWSTKEKWTLLQLKEYANKLTTARVTEPLTRNCLNWFLLKAKNHQNQSLSYPAQEIINYLNNTKEKIVEAGVPLIKNKMTILTHCHSSTVEAILAKAKKNKVKFKLYLTETRPKYQGHITAEELVKLGIDATLITDSEASFLVSKEDQVELNLIIVGADAINKDGSALNKVGSYGISLSAKTANIPFYVTATVLKYTFKEIQIEKRSAEEVWKDKPEKLKIFNPAFDKIPESHITSYITEFGLIKPKKITTIAQEKYPFIF